MRLWKDTRLRDEYAGDGDRILPARRKAVVHEDMGESAGIKERIYANMCVFTENDTTSREATRGTRLSSFTKFRGGTRRRDPQVYH